MMKISQTGDFLMFLRMAAAAILIFKLSVFDSKEGQTASMCHISFKPLLGYDDFLFFKMAAADILDFKKFEILTVGRVKGQTASSCFRST